MSFILPKILGWFVHPSNFLIVGSALAALGALFWQPLRFVTALGMALLAFASFFPLGAFLLQPLEARIPRPAELPQRVDGIIVLGGGVHAHLAAMRGEASTNEHGERLAAGLALARRYPDAVLLYTGGSASLAANRPPETAVARRWYAEAGLAPDRLRLEERSRTTWENAVLSQALLAPEPDQTWVLVTSAFHMPRALAAFQAVGWPVIPWPVDYQTTGRVEVGGLPLASRNLEALDLAAHEWFGLLFYRWSGKTHDLFPSLPQPEGR